MNRKKLIQQQKKQRFEEEEDDLLKTDKERELIRVKDKNNFKKIASNQQKSALENNEDDELDSIEEEDNNNEEEFNKLVNVHKLILKNKITKQNAFDIDIGAVSLQNYSWVNSSNFLKNLSEIHGFKIDNIYQDSYKLLGLINRTEGMEGDDENNNEDPNKKIKQQAKFKDISVEELLKKTNKYKNIINIGEKTLEQKLENLDVIKYDLEFDLDPLLKQTLSKFDDSSNKGLFLTNSHLDRDIILQLESKNEEEGQKNQDQLQEQVIENGNENQEPVQESIYMKFIAQDKNKLKFENPQLCPKLMEFKETLESDAKILKIDYNLTNSESQFLNQRIQKQQQEQDQPAQDQNQYGGMMNELDMLMDDGYYENQEQDLQDQLQQPIQEEQEEDQIQQEEQQQDQEEDEEEEKQQESNQQEEEEEKVEFDMQEAENRLRDIGKGKIDKKLKDKLTKNNADKPEKKSRKKKNELQKMEEEMQNVQKKANNEYKFDFENIEDDEEDKEICFGISKKKQQKLDLKKININQKINHLNLDMFSYQINDKMWDQYYLAKDQSLLELKEQTQAQQQSTFFEDFDMQQAEEIMEEINSEDENEDLFAPSNSQNEKSQVKIRDLKKKVWMDIKTRLERAQKKKTQKKKKSNIPDTVKFSQILDDIPNLMGAVSKKVSLQSSFITILHLCNENILKLEDDQEENGRDFTIIDESHLVEKKPGEEEQQQKQPEQEQQSAHKKKQSQEIINEDEEN